jgi:hypothetical protein
VDPGLPSTWSRALQCWKCWAWFCPAPGVPKERAFLEHLIVHHPVLGGQESMAWFSSIGEPAPDPTAIPPRPPKLRKAP